MTLQERKLMEKLIKSNMVINLVLILAIIFTVIKVVEIEKKVDILIQDVDKNKIKEIQGLSGAIEDGTIVNWSPSYIQGTFDLCVEEKRLGTEKECNIIKEYLGK